MVSVSFLKGDLRRHHSWMPLSARPKDVPTLPREEKKKKRNNNVQIIPKLGLILYMEFSSTPSSIPSFPRFLSPLPITFSRRIKKWLHGCQEVLASRTRLQGYRVIPLLGLCSSPFHPWSSFSPLPEFATWESRKAPYHSCLELQRRSVKQQVIVATVEKKSTHVGGITSAFLYIHVAGRKQLLWIKYPVCNICLVLCWQ